VNAFVQIEQQPVGIVRGPHPADLFEPAADHPVVVQAAGIALAPGGGTGALIFGQRGRFPFLVGGGVFETPGGRGGRVRERGGVLHDAGATSKIFVYCTI
jgi:hypothetical protein